MRNKTISLSEKDIRHFQKNIIVYEKDSNLILQNIINKTIRGNSIEILKKLPDNCFNLIIVDPPYNLDKTFDMFSFKKMSKSCYEDYLETWIKEIVRVMKDNATLYLCGDWKTSLSLYTVASKYLTVLNRITWKRDKGRGSKTNWKNSMEDIWFCVKDKNNYCFNVEDVKTLKKVKAPYKDNKGNPKDWKETKEGKFRKTYPSNFWEDIVIPFWSMPENTEHPTQKPEKLIAKLVLASSKKGDLILDPFLGSGTTSVVAKKLERNYVGIEMSKKYTLIAEKRIETARKEKSIQGYNGETFYEKGE